MKATAAGDWRVMRRVMRMARPYWPHVLVAAVLGLLSAPLALLVPFPLKIVVDTVLAGKPCPEIFSTLLPFLNSESPMVLVVTMGVMVVGIALLQNLVVMGSWLLQTFIGEKLVLDFRSGLFRKLQHLSMTYHDTQGAADSVYRLQYDAMAIQTIAVNGLIPLLSSLATLMALLLTTAALDWQLVLVALSVSPILLVLSRQARSLVREEWSSLKELESSAMGIAQEVLGALRVVKAYAAEEREQGRFVRSHQRVLRGHMRVSGIEAGFDLLIALTVAGGTAGVLILGTQHVLAGTLELGELLMVMAYLTQLYRPLETFGKKAAQLQSAFISAERVLAVLDSVPDVPEQIGARGIQKAQGDVVFEKVSFAYAPDRWALQEISLTVPPGSRVGIAGTTGAGKTTLMSLLTRFYDPSEGRILLDGVDLREYRVADLRNQFAIVLQERNIRYGRAEASDEDVVVAARAANAHDFITRLSDGYDTEIGERGARLSGGERQRIALARAFLKNAPLLILDEPTSSVDVGTEASIMEAVTRLMHGRTTFIIAHRLSTLDACDIHVQLEHGRIASVSDSVAGSVPATPQRVAAPTML